MIVSRVNFSNTENRSSPQLTPGNTARSPGHARGERGAQAGRGMLLAACPRAPVARTGAGGTRATGHRALGFVKYFTYHSGVLVE